MKFDKEIRDLALGFYWQKIYICAREVNGINLFENKSNFSGLQVLFLYWLEIYHILYKELALKEHTNLSENVIKDHKRCDAFLYWRQKGQERQIEDNKQDIKRQTKASKAANRGKQKSYKIFQGAVNKGGTT